MNRLLGQPVIHGGEGYGVVTGSGGYFYASFVKIRLCVDLEAYGGNICHSFWLNGCQNKTTTTWADLDIKITAECLTTLHQDSW